MGGKREICIVGLWHQGIVAAACMADLGYDVLAADHDKGKIEKLSAGKAPLFEPGLDDLLAKGLASGNLRFTSDVGAAVKDRRFVFIMFDTPVDDNDQSDLTEVLITANEIAPALAPDTVLWVTAQVPVGTCDEIRQVIRDTNPDLSFGIAYSPENLRLGVAIERFNQPALPVMGSDDSATLDKLDECLQPIGVTWKRVSLRSAEMTKHALNAFLATQITFGNELGNICDEVGANFQEVARVLRLEERIGNKAMLFPGLGFSGGTLARDMQTLRGLGDKFNLDTVLLDGVWEANKRQNGLVVRKLNKTLGSLKGARIAVFGLTYKPQTSTLRRSAAIEIIADLVREGAVVSATDPKADREELAAHEEFGFCGDPIDAARGADAVVVITGWPEYKDLDYAAVNEAMKGDVLIDCNNMLDGDALVKQGFRYMDVGRGRKN